MTEFKQTTMIVRNVMQVILLITIAMVVIYLDIFEPQHVHITNQEIQSHVDTNLDHAESTSKCPQKQNTIRERIEHKCSGLQVRL